MPTNSSRLQNPPTQIVKTIKNLKKVFWTNRHFFLILLIQKNGDSYLLFEVFSEFLNRTTINCISLKKRTFAQNLSL
jgi:hypothetical protein